MAQAGHNLVISALCVPKLQLERDRLGTDFSLIPKKQLKEIQDQLNERPGKVLDYRTPKEVFEDFILKKL